MFKSRFISSVALIGALCLMVWLEWRHGLFVMAAALMMIALWEFYLMQAAKGLKVFKKAGLICGGGYFLLGWYGLAGFSGMPRVNQALETFAILMVILFVLGRQVFEKDQQTPVVTVALTLFGFFYIPFLFLFLMKVVFDEPLQMGNGVWLGVYVVAVTKVTDIGAYLLGSLFGKHKMIPKISPGKTWEGFVGGVLVYLGVSLLLTSLFPEKLSVISGKHAVILGLILSLVSVVGDLAESVIKRDSKSKDSGGIIPGIGGSLDLIDSLLFTTPLFYSYLVMIS